MRIDQLPVASSATNLNTIPLNIDGVTEQISIGNLSNTIRDNVYGAPLTASTSSAMTDQTRVYVYTGTTSGGFTNGHWYYYNGSAWTDGGVYNSSAVQTDTTLTLAGVPADAAAAGAAVSSLNSAFDGRALLSFTPSFEDNKFIYAPTGGIGNNTAFAISAFIEVDNIYRIYSGFSANYCITFYDDHLQYISYQNVLNGAAVGKWVIIEPPTNAKYLRYVTFKAATPFADTKVEYLNGTITVNEKVADIQTYGLDRAVTFTENETEGYINLSGNVVNAANFKRTNPFILYEGEHVTIDTEGLLNYVAILSKYDGGAYTPIISTAYNAVARYEADIDETGLYAMSYLKRTGATITAKINATTVINELQSVSGGTSNVCCMYDHFTFIGDSITWSQVYTGSSTQRRAFKTYPQVFASLCNAESHTYATPGDTPVLWWTRSSAGAFDHHGLYIVFLGTNDGLTDTIDTDCVGTDPSAFASTNTGQYGRILQTIVNNSDCAVLVLPYGGGGTSLSTTHAVIKKFGAKYDMPVIGITSDELTDLNLHYYPDKSGTNMLHFNDLGYAWLANEVLAEINNLPLSEKFKIMRTQ